MFFTLLLFSTFASISLAEKETSPDLLAGLVAEALENNPDLKAAVEQIDIGGPTLLRAGAKNFHSVTVLPDIVDYAAFMDELKTNDFKVSLAFRKNMAVKTFGMISSYDHMISEYLGRGEL